MKIIHCADAHIDSRMESKLDKAKASIRRDEILDTFCRIGDYAEKQDARAVIIAGDLFDTKSARIGAQNRVLDSIKNHPDIIFYYLKGNHDEAEYFEKDTPDNLVIFYKDGITKYTLKTPSGKNVAITGIVPGADGFGRAYSELSLEYDDINIVVMHGEAGEYGGKNKAESIDLSKLKDRNIDYLALGHYHSFTRDDLDGRGQYCYPGCPEGRGFDEPGECGIVELDINEETSHIDINFVPFAKRTVFIEDVDISECMTTPEIDKLIEDTVRDYAITEDDILRIVLTGETDVDIEKDIEHIRRKFADSFFYFELKDKSRTAIDYDEFLHEASLKGELVRLLKEEDLSEDERGAIVRCAILALKGEEIVL